MDIRRAFGALAMRLIVLCLRSIFFGVASETGVLTLILVSADGNPIEIAFWWEEKSTTAIDGFVSYAFSII